MRLRADLQSKSEADDVIGEDLCIDFIEGQRFEVDNIFSSTSMKNLPNSILEKGSQ